MLDVGQTSSDDAGVGQVRQQLGVLGGRDAVADPLGAEQAQGLPDRLRTGGLPRVRHGPQPGGPGGVEVRAELRPRHPDLRTAQAEAHQGVGAVLERVRQRRVGSRDPGLAGDVVDPPQHQPEVALGRDPRVLDGLGVGLDGDAADHGGVRRARQLGVAQVLALRHLAGDLVGQQPDVLGRADQVDDGEVDLDEVGEVAEGEELPQRLEVGRHTRRRVARRELGDDPRRRRPDVVDVQLGLGEAGDEGLEAHAPQCPRGDVSCRCRPSPPRSRPWSGPRPSRRRRRPSGWS